MRRMATTPITEEYLEAIYVLSDAKRAVRGARLAEVLRVSQPTVTATLKRLMRDGLIEYGEQRTVRLTGLGRTLATNLMRRHRIVECWLTDVLGMGWVESDAEAHRLEHALSEEIVEILNRQLGYPSTCPHGNPIPGNPSANSEAWKPLAGKAAGDNFTVMCVTEPVESAQQILEFADVRGLRPGARGILLDDAPLSGALMVQLGERVISISPHIAANILVL